jgi:hypothetical protein
MKPVNLRVLLFNVHAGQAIYAGALSWLLRFTPGVHLILIQEAQSPKARKALLKKFPASKWHRIGPRISEPGLVGTYVFARKRRFDLLNRTRQKISEGLSGMHPRRDLVGAVLRDKKTGRTISATSVHLWHIRGYDLHGKSSVAAEHRYQGRTVANHHAAGNYDLELAGGDWNEDLDGMVTPVSVRTVLLNVAGMVPTYLLAGEGTRTANLDDLFVRPRQFLTVASRRRIKVPFRLADHPAILVNLKITRA